MLVEFGVGWGILVGAGLGMPLAEVGSQLVVAGEILQVVAAVERGILLLVVVERQLVDQTLVEVGKH